MTAALLMSATLAGCSDPAPEPKSDTPKSPSQIDTGRAPTAPSGLTSILDQDTDDTTSTVATLTIEQPTMPGRLLFLGLEAPISRLWHWQPPRASGQLADFVIPGPQGSEPAQLVIWAPGRSRASIIEHTVPLWAKQFRTGVLPAPPKLEHRNVAGMTVSVVELHGEFSGMGGGWHRPNWRQLSAVFDGPDCPTVVRLHGPSETVEAHREAFMRMVEGLRTTP